MTTREWTYYLTTPAEAAALGTSSDHQVWSAQWVPGLPTDGDPAFVVVAVAPPVAGPGSSAPPPPAPPPGGTVLTSVILAGDKNPWPPPPPPPPANVKDFGEATAAHLGGAAPRSID